MPIQQDLRNVDETYLTTLYESGDYSRALQTIDAWSLLSLLEEQPDAPGHAGLAREAASRVEQSGGERCPWLPGALNFLAEQLHLCGDLAESEKVYERTLALQRRRREPEHPDVAATLRSLAQLYLSRGNVAAAEARFRQALDIRRSCLGDRHPDTAESLNDLAWLLYQAGNLIPAESLFHNALEVRRDCLGAAHPDTLASQHGLALVALARGAPAEAAGLLEQGLALIGDDHPQKLPLMHTLARACCTQGDGSAMRLQEGALASDDNEMSASAMDLFSAGQANESEAEE